MCGSNGVYTNIGVIRRASVLVIYSINTIAFWILRRANAIIIGAFRCDEDVYEAVRVEPT